METIRKTPDDYRVQPNLTDYDRARAQFHRSDVPALCEGMGLRTLADVVGYVEKRGQPGN